MSILFYLLFSLIVVAKCQDPFSSFYGYRWTTDSSSLDLCRSSWGPICCPTTSILERLPPTQYPHLRLTLDSQTAQRCNYTASTYDSTMSYSSNSSEELRGTGMLVRFGYSVYYEYQSKKIMYSIPIPGGSGLCNFTTSVSVISSPSSSSTSGDTALIPFLFLFC